MKLEAILNISSSGFFVSRLFVFIDKLLSPPDDLFHFLSPLRYLPLEILSQAAKMNLVG